MKSDLLFEFQELENMNLPENLLSLIRQTLDDVMLSKNPEKVSCDLTQSLISPKEKRIIIAEKNSVQFLIFPSGLIFIEILNQERII